MALRIVFFGTPAFAVPSLEALLEAGHDVRAVVTRPDRPRGRGRRVSPCPVAGRAREAGLEVWQPGRLRDGSFAERLRAAEPDVGVVVAYGRILPPDVLAVPRLGHLNVHGSILPRHRGASPIEHAILTGDPVTGVSLMRLTEGMDEGPLLAVAETPIGPDETAGELRERLAVLGAEALVRGLRELEEGRGTFRPQDPAGATYAPMLGPTDGDLDWSGTAEELQRRVRAMQPKPGARCRLRDSVLKIHRSRAEPLAPGEGEPVAGETTPGTIVDLGEDGPLVACGQGGLRLLEVQREGRRRQGGRDLVNGARLAVGERLA